ncbi:MAG: M23 family metallopeptidase, partial [Tidjanibacter sp.]|nr:M23 family metallopeptidase [Tidjanibacter sp.]
EHFGTHQHPTQKHITVVNKGVNIAAPKGADVMAIFEGQVARVMFIAGLNNCVMLRHGDYFTIYSNLATVSVKAGESVRANQKLGTLSGGDNPDDYQLHFELWYHTTNQDPEMWFAK